MPTDPTPAQGSTADYCSAFPGEPHHMVGHFGGGLTWIDRCSFCGWIDFAGMNERVEEKFAEREQAAHARGIAEGRRQATEGWNRAWGVQMAWKTGTMTLDCSDRATAEDYLLTLTPEQREIASVVSRLVGSWETAEQPEPARAAEQSEGSDRR